MQIFRPTVLSALLALMIAFAARAQTADSPQTPGRLTAEQAADRQRVNAFLAERTRLSTAAKQALAAEAAREKAGDCPDANSTYAVEMCLQQEGKKTNANYDMLTHAIRAMLALPSPYDDEPLSPGPTGMPLTRDEQVREFDKLQLSWQQYDSVAVSAAYDQFKGGTEASPAAGEASQMLLRSHMRELASVYEFLLGNH